jgi:hypothetical protein
VSKMDDSINKIGMDQTIKAMVDSAFQMSTYYRALCANGLPDDAALALTVALQTSILSQPPRPTPPEDTP